MADEHSHGQDAGSALVASTLSKAISLKIVSGDGAKSSAVAAVSGKIVFPIAGETWSNAEKSSGFGDRVHPITGKLTKHWGLDLPAAKGIKVLATESGTVLDVKLSDSGCGNEIELQFADGTGARYCHLSAIHVEKGQSVDAGDAIGEVGSTGDATGDHLHFERTKDGQSIDPTSYLESTEVQATATPAAAAPTAANTTAAQGNLKWQFDFDPSISEADKQAVNEAAAKLSAIVTTDQTIAVKVTVQNDDGAGAWIAKGKPLQEGLTAAGLPTQGSIVLNAKYPIAVLPVEHELLHVMGFGTIDNWFAAVDTASHTFKADTLAGASYGGAIPLSPDNAHWSEEALGSELMTPYAEKDGVDMPIEKVTIEALKDLGWTVSGGQ